MALLKGKGAMTGVNLLARTFDNNVTKDGKTRFVDVQLDARDSRGANQTNLHLMSTRTTDDKGKVRFNNGAPYSASQFEKMVETAGPNHEPILDKDGQTIGHTFAVKANVMPSSKGSGLVINTDTLEQSDFKIDDKTMDNQFASMKEARVAQQEAREAAQTAAESQVEAPEASADVPLFDYSEADASVDEPSVG